jgi:hypothetical protein
VERLLHQVIWFWSPQREHRIFPQEPCRWLARTTTDLSCCVLCAVQGPGRQPVGHSACRHSIEEWVVDESNGWHVGMLYSTGSRGVEGLVGVEGVSGFGCVACCVVL